MQIGDLRLTKKLYLVKKIAKPTGLYMSIIEYPMFLIEINSLFEIKFL